MKIGRFKTGTPPRVKASSINYEETEIQPGDEKPNHFSFLSKDEDYLQDQIPCWLTYTNQESHDIINNNLHRAPMFSGIVKGVGPRYCPSIEDKIVRFADKIAINFSLNLKEERLRKSMCKACQLVCQKMFKKS